MPINTNGNRSYEHVTGISICNAIMYFLYLSIYAIITSKMIRYKIILILFNTLQDAVSRVHFILLG